MVRQRARVRVQVLGGLLLALMLGSAVRGVSLIAEPYTEIVEEMNKRRWSSRRMLAPRGEILDAEGHVLAMSVRTPEIAADPRTIRDRLCRRVKGADCETTPYAPEVQAQVEEQLRDVSAQVAEVLGMPASVVLEKLSRNTGNVRLSRNADRATVEALKERGLTQLGLKVDERYRRYYPMGDFAGQAIGYLGPNNEGATGLENYFQEELNAESVRTRIPVNRLGAGLALSQRDRKALEGSKVYTTLDRRIQRSTERALLQVMEHHAPVGATAVVIHVPTGRILALASVPSFNPNQVGRDILSARNRALADAIEPGSVFKPFTLAAALEEGKARPGEIIDTTSPHYIGRTRIRDDHPHDSMTVEEMVKFSSNVGAAKLAHRLGGDMLVSYFKAFGFGERTGVVPYGEAAGLRHPPGRLGPVELATISYGQGTTATAMQLAVATATLANDGVRLRPRLVDRVEDAQGRLVASYDRVEVKRVVSPQVAATVRRAMGMVLEEGGTGTRARVRGYTAGGKTGTAYKVKNGAYSNARYATFIGIAPLDEPVLAMAVFVDEPTQGSRYGGVVAGPVFADVMAEALPHLGVEPNVFEEEEGDEPEGQEDFVPAEPVELRSTQQGWQLPNLVGRPMRDALVSLQGTGLELAFEGSGAVVSQRPSPGSTVQPGDRVELVLR